jgi:hypothetical protein
MGRVMEPTTGHLERMSLIDLQELTFETVAQVVQALRERGWSDDAARESLEDAIVTALGESGGP